MTRTEAIAIADRLVDECIDRLSTRHGVLTDAELCAIAFLSGLADPNEKGDRV